MAGKAAPAAAPDDFGDLFGGSSAPKDGAEDMEGDDSESEEAVDAAIDEAFSTEDPTARREAFKNAVRLCKEY